MPSFISRMLTYKLTLLALLPALRFVFLAVLATKSMPPAHDATLLNWIYAHSTRFFGWILPGSNYP
ncbi:hypothetical protein H7097_03740 [Aeromicrobium sp.]|nr:hypothetical protein [Candidatus Saccharibacteria bacterium]